VLEDPAATGGAPRGPRALAHGLSVVAVVVALAAGTVLRAWLLTHVPLFGDEAVIGLMAQHIQHGDTTAFIWGQDYGGAEPYLVAGVFSVFGSSPMALNIVPAILAALAAVLSGAVAYELTGRPRLAWLGGALVWVWPYAALWNSVRENGFRGVALVCGLATVLCALRLWRGRRTVSTYAVLGLAAGVGWWASPEMIYFVVPVGVILVGCWVRLRDPGGFRSAPWRPGPVVLVAVGAVVGALPWLYANVNSGFATLRRSNIPSAPGEGYTARLSIFFHDTLPLQLGLRSLFTGAWIGSQTLGLMAYGLLALLLVAAVVEICRSLRTGRRAVPAVGLAAGLVVLPFLFAAFPSSWYWLDGRYGGYLAPFIMLVALAAVAGPPVVVPDPAAARRGRHAAGTVDTGRAGALRSRQSVAVLIGSSVVVLAALALTGAGAQVASGAPVSHPVAFFKGWGDPNAEGRAVVAAMAADHITVAYGDYWTAYVLDFLGPHTVVVSPSPLDVDRWPAEQATVARDPHAAWLFFAPGQEDEATGVFSNPERGPGTYTEASFLQLLKSQGIAARVVHLGVLDAVVAARPVTLP
jgi:hypothetical protein